MGACGIIRCFDFWLIGSGRAQVEKCCFDRRHALFEPPSSQAWLGAKRKLNAWGWQRGGFWGRPRLDGHSPHEGEIDYPGEGDEAWSHYLNRLRAKTRRLVRRHHKKIERVALALMQPQVLPVEEVDALLSEPAAGSAATEY